MIISKSAYATDFMIGEIDAAIELLCMEEKRCTPTDVLRLIKTDESNAMRRLVVYRAIAMEYTVKSSGRGYVILDQIFDE